MLNKVLIIGRLGGDPELKYLPSGQEVTNFNVAVNEKWTKKDGEKTDHTEWFKITAIGRIAGICAEYLKKGSLIFAEGKLRTRSWERDGVKRYATEIFLSNMQMLDGKKNFENRDDDRVPPDDDDVPF